MAVQAPQRRFRGPGRRARAAAVACTLLAGGCATTLKPADFAGRTPEFRPEAFFAGATHSTGVLQSRSGAPSRLLRVDGAGRLEADGVLRLDQTVTFADGRVQTRSWRMRRLDAHHYAATLTDAAGPVRAEAYGDLFHLRYVIKGAPLGAAMEQWLYLQPDGRTVLNEAAVRVLGLTIARLSERITREGPAVGSAQ